MQGISVLNRMSVDSSWAGIYGFTTVLLTTPYKYYHESVAISLRSARVKRLVHIPVAAVAQAMLQLVPHPLVLLCTI